MKNTNDKHAPSEIAGERACPFHGCTNRVREGMLACRIHWFELTPAERRRIWIAYDDFRTGLIDLDEFRRRQQEVLRSRGKA
jgi:hypothetical protein